MKLRPSQVISLATANIFCLLLYFFKYSFFSLFFLFCSFLLTLGIGLHLFYMSTQQDEYLDRQTKVVHSRKRILSDWEKSKSKVEYVPPKIIVKAVLRVYGGFLEIRRHLIDIVTLRDSGRSQQFLFGVPSVLYLMYFFRISDTFVLMVCLNYLILREQINH